MGVALLAPTSASANVDCTLVLDDTLTVTFTDAASPQASLQRSGSTINVYDGPTTATPEVCTGGPVTVTNVDAIVVNDFPGHDATLLVSLQGGGFEPGENDTPPLSSVDSTGPEIEISFAAGNGTSDQIELDGSDSADDFDLGQTAGTTFNANVNPAADGAMPDCDDVSATGVEDVIVRGRGGDDDVNATSCNGIGGGLPLDPDSLALEGGNQADAVRGGPGVDSVLGGTQDDNVKGGDGNDSIDGERDNDKVDGGVGADTLEGGTETDRVFYDDRATVVTATIGNGGADDGGSEDQSGGNRDNIGLSIENLTGGSAGDSVTGSSTRNVVNSGAGDDVLLGVDGNDELQGEDGNDTLDGGGGKDELRGLAGTDTERGGGASDQLFGGDSADKLFGGNGGDVLKGDKGKDSMSGQAGNDKINAKDRKRDTKISCGKGKASKESAKVDKQDPKAKSC